MHCSLLPQCVLSHTSLLGEAGGQDAQGDPRPGVQESQNCGRETALYKAERCSQESREWYRGDTYLLQIPE